VINSNIGVKWGLLTSFYIDVTLVNNANEGIMMTKDEIISSSVPTSKITNFNGSCIYFLIDRNVIVYVGKTKEFINRIITHLWSNKEFDRYFFIETNDNLEEIEKKYIKEFCPLLNKNSKKGKGRLESSTIAARVNKEISEKLKQIADNENKSMSDLLEEIIVVWMHER